MTFSRLFLQTAPSQMFAQVLTASLDLLNKNKDPFFWSPRNASNKIFWKHCQKKKLYNYYIKTQVFVTREIIFYNLGTNFVKTRFFPRYFPFIFISNNVVEILMSRIKNVRSFSCIYLREFLIILPFWRINPFVDSSISYCNISMRQLLCTSY